MENLDIIIDGKHYSFIKVITYNDKNYVAYTDYKDIFISEYAINNGEIELLPTDENIVELVKGELINE